MGFTRRVFLGGGAGFAAALGTSTILKPRRISAQSGAWEVVDLITLTEAVSFGGRDYRGTFRDMNSAGEVGGEFAVSDIKFSPTIWSPEGKATRLKSGKFGGQINAINNAGLAVGSGYLGVLGFESEESFDSRYTAPRAWADGKPVDLEILADDPKASTGQVYDVNDDGIMVGQLADPALNVSVPVMWQDGAVTVLFSGSEGTGKIALRVNNAGDIAGYVTVQTDSGDRVESFDAIIIWRGDEIEILQLPSDVEVPEDASAFLSLKDLSENGQVLTTVTVVNDTDYSNVAGYAYVFENGTSTRLVSPDESLPFVLAGSINASGVVVGFIHTLDFSDRAFTIWEDGVGRILDDELELPSGLTLSTIIKINDEGQMLATAVDAEALHALILRPA